MCGVHCITTLVAIITIVSTATDNDKITSLRSPKTIISKYEVTETSIQLLFDGVWNVGHVPLVFVFDYCFGCRCCCLGEGV